jgi:uncharacterized OsmC-like protein
MNLREVQKPLKDGYREHPESSRITLVARGGQGDAPIACSVDLGRAIYEAQAHAGVGGAGTAACSGDLLLGALAACAQVTCQMVAASMEVPIDDIAVTVEGDLDLSGTLGLSRDVPVGFAAIRVRFDLTAPEASQAQLDSLIEKTERYCVVLQTLQAPPVIETRVVSASGATT